MSSTVDSLLQELDQEAATTRRVLERVPDDKLMWKPHPKSWTLGQLALHTASVPGTLAGILTPDSFEIANFVQAQPASMAEILDALTAGTASVRTMLEGLTPERALFVWRLVAGGKDVLAAPRMALVRSLVFNHLYHHRGQLLTYLRLLDVPVPSVYGPTADENPFSSTVRYQAPAAGGAGLRTPGARGAAGPTRLSVTGVLRSPPESVIASALTRILCVSHSPPSTIEIRSPFSRQRTTSFPHDADESARIMTSRGPFFVSVPASTRQVPVISLPCCAAGVEGPASCSIKK